MKNVLRKILDHLETELFCYQELSKTYDEQKDVLVKNKHQELEELDNRFIALHNKITKLDTVRKNLFNELKTGTQKLSDIIKIAEMEESPHLDKLKEYQAIFKNLKQEIENKRFVNFELLKNGLSITDKKLGIIIEAVVPQGSIYNKRGTKSKGLKNLSVSTINQQV